MVINPPIFNKTAKPIDPELKLYERDNIALLPLGHYPVWHLWTCLSVSFFSESGNTYSDSITAVADSPFSNWWLESDNLKTVSISSSSYSEINAYGNAYFYGYFTLGLYDYWYAFPNITEGAFFPENLNYLLNVDVSVILY